MDNNGFLEAGVKANRFLYQGKEWQKDLGLNLYDFHARQFDPALGRFISADAANQFVSPYLGMGNMPTMGVDPDGNFVFALPIIYSTVFTAWSVATTAAVITASAIVATTATLAVTGAFSSSAVGLSAFGGGCPFPPCNGSAQGELIGSGTQEVELTLKGGIPNDGVRELYRPINPISMVPKPASLANTLPTVPSNVGTGNFVSGRSIFSLKDLYSGSLPTTINSSLSLPKIGNVALPGFFESMIPFWGSGKSMIHHFQNGNIGMGVLNAGIFASDFFLAGSIAKGIGKGGLKMLSKSYKYWSGYRRAYGKYGYAMPYQHLHHWLWRRNGSISGEGIAWWAKNQMWNLMPMPDRVFHQALHGFGEMNKLEILWYGSPAWFKVVIIDGGLRLINGRSYE